MSALLTDLNIPSKKLEVLTPSVVLPTDKLNVFKSTQRYVNYVFHNGMLAEFINHKFYTKRPEQIAELENEIKSGHPLIYIDPNEKEIIAEDRDPNVALKKKLRAELIAEGYALVNPANDMGESNQGKLNAASTSDIAVTAAGGNGNSGMQLAQLAATLANKSK